MSGLLIRGGRILDPTSGRDEPGSVLVGDGRIQAVGPDLDAQGAEVVDAQGAWIAPGFFDMRSAVAGGFTAVACMANTHPVNDDPAMTDYILDRALHDSPAKVYPIAAATRGLEGEVMSEMAALVGAGAVAFSDDGRTIMDSEVMRRVLEYSHLVGVPIIVHCEDRSLVGNGVVNEGPVSTKLGLPSNPAAAEELHVVRDLMLAELTGAHLHIAHVSTAGSVEAVRRARERGVNVTAEVTPHHLTLTDEAALGYDTNTKVAPPLRSASDVAACRAGLVDGTLDAIATDHAPHAQHEKEQEFTEAPSGMIGFETAAAVVLDLVRKEEITPLELIRRMSANPARILGKPGGSLFVGEPADVVVLDPEQRWTYDPVKGYSKSSNSPWAGEKLTGRVVATLVDGKLVYHVDRGVLVP
jgi:dihydroorotase